MQWRDANHRHRRRNHVRADGGIDVYSTDYGNASFLGNIVTKYVLVQIVLLVTKAVGDFLGTNGIADEMIRFNGYPFLEKEDHAYNVSGKYNTKQRYRIYLFRF